MKRENNKKFKKRKRNQNRSLTCRVLSMMFAIVLFCSTVLINTDYVSQASSFDDMVDMVEVEEDSAAADTSEDTGDDLDTDVNFESESEEGSAETYSESDDFGSSDADFSSGENMFTDGTSESSAPAEEAAQPVSCIVNLKNETIEIKAEAPAGVLPNGTQMIVKAVENNTEDAEMTDQYNKLAAKITEQLQSQSKNLDGFLAYNVSFTDADGNPVEPAGKVNYSFTYKEASSPELTDPAASTVTAAMIRTNKETSELELTELKAEEDKLTVETNESRQLTKAAFQSAATAAYTFVWSSAPAADDNENNENKEENSEVNNGEVNTDTNTENTEENGEVTNTENNVENSEEEQNPEEAPDQEQIKMIRVIADEVNLRVAPSTEADVIATVDTDTQLPLLETVTDEDEFTWYKVSYEESEAYVRSDMAEVVENEEQEAVVEEEQAPEAEQSITYESTVDGVKIVVTAPNASVLPENAELVVTKIDNTEEIEQIKDAIAPEVVNNQTSIKDLMAFDIKFMLDGQEIQPNGEVKVEFQNTGYDTENGISVYHVDDEKTTATDMQAVVDEEKVEFQNTGSNTDNGVSVEQAADEETTDADMQVAAEEGENQVSETTSANVSIDTTHFSTYVVVNNGSDKIKVTIEHWLYDETTNKSSQLYKDKIVELASGADEQQLSQFTMENDEFGLRDKEPVVEMAGDGTETAVGEKIVVDSNVTIRCYYVAKLGNYTNGVTMFDYDITDKDGKNGINTLSNYKTNSTENKKIMMGQKSETGLNYQCMVDGVADKNGYNGNQAYNINANNQSRQPIIPGIVTSLSGDRYSQVNFGYGLDEPGYFTSEDKIGKRVLDGYSLKFEKNGYKYTLTGVSKDGETVASDLNNFWPLDKNRGYDGMNSGSDDGGSHNWYFAMRYDFKFKLGDYMGDLTYSFNGDDDLWVFMDGQPIIDLGGLHSAYPENDFNGSNYDYSAWTDRYPNTVDLWDKLGGKDGADRNAEHTITVLFMERGGYGSNCNMEFVLPNVTSTEPVISTTPKADLSLKKVNSNDAPIEGVEFKLVGGNNSEIKAISGADGVVTFSNLREGREYTLTEVKAPDEYVTETTSWIVKVEKDTSNTLKAVLYKDDKPLTANADGKYHIVNYTQKELVEQSVESNKTVSLMDWDKRTYKIDLTASSKVTQTTTVSVPFDIVMVLDVSGSMSDPFYEYEKYTGTLKEGGKYYIKTSSGIYEQIASDRKGNWKYCDTYNNNKYVTVTQGSTDIFTKKQSSINKLVALKNAANSFVDNVAAKNSDNRISVVTFAGGSTIKESDNQKWLLRTKGESLETIKSWIKNLSANGATNSAAGLGDAVNVFDSKKSTKWEDVKQNTGRQKMVVFLTDGVPTKHSSFSSTVANSAISNAQTLKSQKTTIYSLGIFDSADYDGEISDGTVKQIDDYMKGVASSNEKYMTADSISSLNGLFDSITNSMPVAVTATVTDIIDKRFELTADSRTTLEAGGATIKGNSDGSTTITWTDTEIPGKKDSGTTDIEKAGWHKEIYIRAKDAYIGGNDVPTNGTGSGINVGNNHLEFPKPTVNVKVDFNIGKDETVIFKGDAIAEHFSNDVVNGITKLVSTTGTDYTMLNDVNVSTKWYTDAACEHEITAEEIKAAKPIAETVYYAKVTVTPKTNGEASSPNSIGDGKAKEKYYRVDPAGVTKTGTYTVKIVSGAVQIEKQLETAAAKDETFTFIITSTDVAGFEPIEVSLTIATGETRGTLSSEDLAKLNSLPRGTYEVTESDVNGYALKNVSVTADKTNCYSSVTDDKVSFTLGSDSKQKDVIAEKTYATAGILGVAAFTNEKVTSDWGIKKVSAKDNNQMVSGAVFKLAPATSDSSLPTYYGKSQADGTVKWYSDDKCENAIEGTIQKGSYTLSEIASPTGYMLSTETWSIEIASKGALKLIQSGGQDIATEKVKKETINGKEFVYYLYEDAVVYSLPEAGGPGIYGFTISGVAFITAALLLFINNKRKEDNIAG